MVILLSVLVMMMIKQYEKDGTFSVVCPSNLSSLAASFLPERLMVESTSRSTTKGNGGHRNGGRFVIPFTMQLGMWVQGRRKGGTSRG